MDHVLLALAGLLASDMLLGLRASRTRWREVAGGRTGIFTLRMLTGISDRDVLARRFGAWDPTYHCAVSPDQVRAAQTTARRIFDQTWLEWTLLGLVVLAGALSFFPGFTELGLVIVCGAALYRSFFWGYTVLVLLRSHRQRLEEGRAKMRYARENAG